MISFPQEHQVRRITCPPAVSERSAPVRCRKSLPHVPGPVEMQPDQQASDEGEQDVELGQGRVEAVAGGCEKMMHTLLRW